MKILFKLFAILVIFNSTAIADIISKVEVKGNQRISKDTIIVLGEIQLNQDFDNIKLNETLKKLYETNFFDNISLSIDDEILKINVIENPIIENIEITGIKNKKILEDITNKISLKDRMSFTENLLNNH